MLGGVPWLSAAKASGTEGYCFEALMGPRSSIFSILFEKFDSLSSQVFFFFEGMPYDAICAVLQ